jgi:uncharacterized protein YacL
MSKGVRGWTTSWSSLPNSSSVGDQLQPNRVAELQGVTILNINELANAVKSVVLPGEILRINIIQEGKEVGQGVGYMDDGTMVVIENGKSFIGEYMEVHITKVLQTAAGRMIFGRVDDSHNSNGNSKRKK